MIQRNKTLDITKAFAIILVIAGHAIQLGSGEAYLKNELYYENSIFKFIYSFHMPLFMLISGYLFAFTIKRDNRKNLLKQRFKSLVCPIFIWALIPFSIKLCRIDEINLLDIPKIYVGTVICYLWYLWSLFFSSVIVMFVDSVGGITRITAYGLIFVLMFFIPDRFNLACYKFMLPYFMLGFYFNKSLIPQHYNLTLFISS